MIYNCEWIPSAQQAYDSLPDRMKNQVVRALNRLMHEDPRPEVAVALKDGRYGLTLTPRLYIEYVVLDGLMVLIVVRLHAITGFTYLEGEE